MAVSLNPGEMDRVDFRSGKPVYMTAWMDVKSKWYTRQKQRFVNLNGEVLSIYLRENQAPPEDQFDVPGAVIDFSNWRAKRSFRISKGRRTYTCLCGSFEEMQCWAKTLIYASQRSFEKNYQLGALLAEGSFSKVHFAYATNAPKLVFAVKIIKRYPNDDQSVKRGRRERYINSVLNHPSIVQTVDIFSTIEKDYIVMELMRGGTLENVITERQELLESDAKETMRQIVHGVNHIHSKNIVHRDLRPGNIFRSDKNFPLSVAIGDFGTGTVISGNRVNDEVLATRIGMPNYVCLEMLRGVKYGPKADMWSLGVLLYEMLSGEPPFLGRSDREVLSKIRNGIVSFSKPVWNEISGNAQNLILQLLQPDPFKRISAFACAQHQWLNTVPSFPRQLFEDFHGRSTALVNDSSRRSRHSMRFRTASRRHQPLFSTGRELGRIQSLSSHVKKGQREPEVESADDGEESIHRTGSSTISTRRSSSASISSESRQPIRLTPSVRAVTEKGLYRVASDNPTLMGTLLESRVVQAQLSAALPYRRKFVVVARSFVAVFRMRALLRGHSMTRQVSLVGSVDVNGVLEIIDKRSAALAKATEDRNRQEEDR